VNFNLNKIVKEWSYRVHDGMPDVKDPLHMVELQQVLHEMKYPRKFIEGLLRRLREERVKAWNKGTKSRPEGFWTTVSPDTLEDPVKGKQYSTERPKDEDEVDEKDIKDKEKGTWEDFKDMNVLAMKKAGLMKDGMISLPFKTRILKIRMGKKTGGDYKQRLVDVLNNPVLQSGDNPQHLENMLNELENFKSNPDDPEALQRALDAAKILLATGSIDVSISELGNPPNNYISVRINNAPIYTFDSGPHTEAIVDAARENEIAKRKGASDSSKWKPQAPGGQGLLPEEHKPAEEIGEPLTSLGVGIRGQRYGKGQEAQNGIADTLQAVVDQERAKEGSAFSEAELQAIEDYNKILKDTTLSPDEKKEALKAQFLKLRQSSTEPNEVHKNFGEIHAAATLSVDYPNGEVIFPMEGNAGFHDFVMVFGDEGTGFKVVEFPVKAAGTSKGVGSSWKTIYKSFTFEDSPEAERAQENLNWLADTIGGMSSSAQDKLLDNENAEETQRTKVALDEMWNTVDEETQVAILEKLGIEDWDQLSTRDKYGWFVNKALLQEAMYKGAVEPHIDEEKTGNRARYAYVYDDGTVETRKNKVSCYKFGSPKREKVIEGKPYKRGQVIQTFNSKCLPTA